MEIGQLEAFIAVVHEGSFTQAADRLNLTQPSLSVRVQQLEQTLGGPLFQRRRRPVQLTALGEIFITYAERALGVLEAGQEAVRSARLGIGGRVTVCCPFSLASSLMPDVVNRFTRDYPTVELYVESGPSDFAVRQLLDGMVNLALAAAFPRFLEQADVLLRLHDEMIVAVNPQHALAGAAGIPVAQLWQYRVLIIHWGAAFTAYVESLIEKFPQPVSTIRVPLAAALPMMQQPDAVAFLPRRLAAVSDLVELNVPQFQFAWDSVLLTRPGRALATWERRFVDVVSAVWHD